MKHWLALIVLVGCGSSSSKDELYGVGTYIGGGSHLTGPDDCEYTGTPTVFRESAKPEKGPRFILGAGTITIKCPKGSREVTAVVPTGAKIWHEKTMKVGAKQQLTANLVANGRTVNGEPRIEWRLGDCANVAEFGPVLGAQDTGGQDRSRHLIATGKGKCQLTMTLMTGTEAEHYQGQGWQDSVLITVE